MADEAGGAGEQQAPANPANQAQNASQQPATGQQEEYKGAGGKDALKADLAKERDKRQALETQVAELGQFRDGLAKLFGAKPDELTPEQLQAKLTAAEQASAAQAKQLAVYGSAPAGVDVKALLDSHAFLTALDGAENKPEAISKVVTDFLRDNPRFSTASPAAWRDANASGTPTTDADAEALRVLGF